MTINSTRAFSSESENMMDVQEDSPIQLLPTELLNYIFSFLNACSLVAVDRVCCQWRAVTVYNWKQLCSNGVVSFYRKETETNWKALYGKITTHKERHFLRNVNSITFCPQVKDPVTYRVLEGNYNLKIFKQSGSSKKEEQIYKKEGVRNFIKFKKTVYFISNSTKFSPYTLFVYDLNKETVENTKYKIHTFLAQNGEYLLTSRRYLGKKRKRDELPQELIENTLVRYGKDGISEIATFLPRSPLLPTFAAIKKNKVFYQGFGEKNFVVYDILKNTSILYPNLSNFLDFYLNKDVSRNDFHCTDNCFIFFSKKGKNKMSNGKFLIQFFDEEQPFTFKALDYLKNFEWIALKIKDPRLGFRSKAFHVLGFYNLIKSWHKEELSLLTSFKPISYFERDLNVFSYSIISGLFYIHKNILLEVYTDEKKEATITLTDLMNGQRLKSYDICTDALSHCRLDLKSSKDKQALFLTMEEKSSNSLDFLYARIL